jgi:uncharacterized protein
MLAVVTGASSGIGAEFARKLASRGFDLTLVARREDRLRAIAQEVSALHHVRAEALPADLVQDAHRSRVADHVRSAPDLGLLVNNAGFGVPGFFFETEPDAQERMHRLHILTTMLLTHAALSNLIPKARSGTGVINVSSVAAFAAMPVGVTYGASKTWMNAFTSGLAAELAVIKSPVRVQALCPGFTLTEFHDVVHVDRSQVPRALWLTPDFVVQESLRAFDRGQTIVIPDWRYNAIARFMRIAPQSWLRRAARRRSAAK